MIMLPHGWRGYPTFENIYDFYSRGIIGVIVHGHVIIGVIVHGHDCNKYIYTAYMY